MLHAADAAVVLRKILAIAGGEIARRPARCCGKVIKLAGLRRRQNQRPVLGANGVIRRHHAGLAEAGQILAVDESQHAIAATKIQHQPSPGAFDFLVLVTARPAHDRSDFWKRRHFAPQNGRSGFLMSFDKCFSERNHLDHALIGFARGFAESDNAVLAENEPVARLFPVEDFDRLLGEAEARH